MSRPLRIDYPDAWHHVMNRARRGQDLFCDSTDYQLFIELLMDTTALFNIRVAAYCLMTNHYHLLVQTPDANLSRCMRHINGVFTQRYNARHGCDGTLFRGRYKSVLVDADSYVLQLVRYIHNNPLKAGLVKRAEHYIWSSHKGYLSKAKKWQWLYKDFVLAMIAPQPANRIETYRQYMAQDEDEKLLKIFRRSKLPSMLGSISFISDIKARFSKKRLDRQIPAAKSLAPDIEDITAKVCKIYKVDSGQLCYVRRGIKNEPRDVAIYLIRILRGEPLMRIGSRFNLNAYSSVSSAVLRIKDKLGRDRKLAQRIKKIQAGIRKGQTEI